MLGPNSNEYTVRPQNQQLNQLTGRLPNWQSRLGTGTAGGGVNLQPPQQNSGAIQSNPNVSMMIRALMNRG
jgi:hypothetical protein